MKVGIIGTGAYGIALAEILNKNKLDVILWTKFEKEYNELKDNKIVKTLNNHKISDKIKFTLNINEIMNCNLIYIAIPQNALKEICNFIKPLVNNQYFCIATKGIGNNKTIANIVNKLIKTKKIGLISGPTFAIDIINNVPIGFTVASFDENTIQVIKNSLANDVIYIETTKDIEGISVCGAVKNIFAIGSGIIKGLNLPISTHALYITKVTHEIRKLIIFFNGNEESILTLAGIGDLVLTCFSEKSRNFTFGIMICKKKKNEIYNYIKSTTIEGINTLKMINILIEKQKIELPIIKCIYNIIYKNNNPTEILSLLN